MTTYDMPKSLAARLPARSVERFRTYTPKPTVMPTALWEKHRLALLTLLADTAPPTDDDARHVLSTACGFFAWVVKLHQQEDVTLVFTTARIEAYISALASTRTESTRISYRASLNRFEHAIQGLEPVTRRADRPEGGEPYRIPALEALLDAAAASGPLSRVLAVALTTGQASTRAVGHPIPTRDQAAAGLRRLGLDPAPAAALRLDGEPALQDREWQDARRAAQRVQHDLDAGRLRMTWVIPIMSTHAPIADLVREHNVSRRDLENSLAHVPTPDPDTTRTLLRG